MGSVYAISVTPESHGYTLAKFFTKGQIKTRHSGLGQNAGTDLLDPIGNHSLLSDISKQDLLADDLTCLLIEY